MSDDPKIIPLPTGYTPQEAPVHADEIQLLRWDISLLAEEVTELSKLLRTLVKVLRK